jgi:hypothetical protein
MLPSEVKKLAQYLWDNKITIANAIKNMEVVERNVVGRFYYYVYLKIPNLDRSIPGKSIEKAIEICQRFKKEEQR